MPWTFEPHGAFRSYLEGEEWPFGYISEGPGKPIFALHEVVGDRSPEELLAAARIATAAPEMLEALTTARIALIAVADSAVEAGFDQLANIIDEQLGKANNAIAKARGEAL